MLIPLDGSKVAEQVLPYARYLAKTISLPVEVFQAVDPTALESLANPEQGRYVDTLLNEKRANSAEYLETVGRSFKPGLVASTVEIGKPEDLILEKAAADPKSLIIMATHGRSGIQRWMLGSVADKVLHGVANDLFLIRATEQGNTEGAATLSKVIVPLDGSPLAEKVLPRIVELGKQMPLEVILMRAYALPPAIAPNEYAGYGQELFDQLETEAKDYLSKKAKELAAQGLSKISSVVDMGYGAEEITALAHKTPDNFIAMCTHGRSGVKRWALGSVADRVVRHSGDPVLIIRAAKTLASTNEERMVSKAKTTGRWQRR
jgi:nucleotide-binding universal stress UspA family protein